MPVIPTAQTKAIKAPMISPQFAGQGFKALEQAGGELFDVGEKIYEAEQRVKALKIESAMKKSIQQFNDVIATSNNYEDFGDMLAKFKETGGEEFVTMAGENSTLAESSRIAWQTLVDDAEHKTNLRKIELMGEEAKLQLTDDASYIIQSIAAEPDPARRKVLIDSHQAKHEVMIGSGLITRTDSEKILEPMEYEVAAQTMRNALEAAPGTHEAKLDWLASQTHTGLGIPRKYYNQLVSDLKIQWSIDKYREKEIRRKKKEEQAWSGFEAKIALAQGSLDPDQLREMVHNESIDPTTGGTLLDKWMTTQKRRFEEYEKILDKENKRLNAKNAIRIGQDVDAALRGERDPEEVIDGIIEAISEGQISPTQGRSEAKRLGGSRSTSSPLKNPAYLNNLLALDKWIQVKNRAAKNEEEIFENSSAWARTRTQFQVWMESNPKATPEEINRYFEQALMKPLRKKLVRGWFRRLNWFRSSDDSAEEKAPSQNQFEVGKIYFNAQGEKAEYLGKDEQGQDLWQLK